MTPTQALTAEEWMRNRWGAYRGHFAWREIEEAFNAGAALSAAPAATVEPVAPVAEVGDLILSVRERVMAAGLLNRAPLYAAPVPAEPALTWQPIETAPKDGRRLLVAIEGADRGVVALWNGNAWDTVDANSWAGRAVTHWMPLPAAPKE